MRLRMYGMALGVRGSIPCFRLSFGEGVVWDWSAVRDGFELRPAANYSRTKQL